MGYVTDEGKYAPGMTSLCGGMNIGCMRLELDGCTTNCVEKAVAPARSGLPLAGGPTGAMNCTTGA